MDMIKPDIINDWLNCSTSEEIDAALRSAERAMEAAKSEAEALAESRDQVLLSGDDQAADEHEAKLNGAYRNVDRLGAAVQALEKRLEEAERAEVVAQVQGQLAKARQAQERGMALMHQYNDHAGAIAELISELKEIHAVIEQARHLAKTKEVGCDVRLPWQALHIPDEYAVEDVRHVQREGYHKAGQYSDNGTPIGDFREKEVFKRERVLKKRGRWTRDLTHTEIRLPDAMDRERHILYQG